MDNHHSKEWHDFRSKGIGSSDAGVLVGFTQWKSVTDLWLEKIGQSKKRPESNSNIDRGIKLEPAIRADIELRYDMDLPELKYQVHPDYDFIRANLDGWNDQDKIILECKAPNEKAHQCALNGFVPDYYIPQIQHLMMVMDCSSLIYASMFGNRVAVVEVEPFIEVQENLLKREIEFWGFVTRKEKPPEGW